MSSAQPSFPNSLITKTTTTLTLTTYFLSICLLYPVHSSTKPQYAQPQFPIQFQFQQYGEPVAENEDYYSPPSAPEPLGPSIDPKFWFDSPHPVQNQVKILTKKEVGHNPEPQETENIQAVAIENHDSIFTQRPFYLGLIIGSTVFGTIVLIGAALCYWKISKRIKSTAKVDYKPSTTHKKTNRRKSKSSLPSSDLGHIDSKLASSAHMYHYQSQKQKMKPNLIPNVPNGRGRSDTSGETTENEETAEDYTIYECPGLARAGGDLVVRNPLFSEPLQNPPIPPAVPEIPINNHTNCNSTHSEENQLKPSELNGQN